MLERAIISLLPEITAIEARTEGILKKTGYVFLSDKFPLDRDNRVWLPVLCLLAGKMACPAGNNKVISIAGILHLVNYASRLHWQIPEASEPRRIKQELQYPILVGDYLYSQVYLDLCQMGLREYLLPLSSLIASINEELLLRDQCKRRQLPARRHEISIYGMLSESACFLGAHTAGNTYLAERLRPFGYHLGLLRGLSESDEDIAGHAASWYECCDILQTLPDCAESSLFNDMLVVIGEKWRLHRPRQRNIV